MVRGGRRVGDVPAAAMGVSVAARGPVGRTVSIGNRAMSNHSHRVLTIPREAHLKPVDLDQSMPGEGTGAAVGPAQSYAGTRPLADVRQSRKRTLKPMGADVEVTVTAGQRWRESDPTPPIKSGKLRSSSPTSRRVRHCGSGWIFEPDLQVRMKLRVSVPEAHAAEVDRLAGLVDGVDGVTLHNEQNGFCAVRLMVKGEGDLITPIGPTPAVSPGEYLPRRKMRLASLPRSSAPCVTASTAKA